MTDTPSGSDEVDFETAVGDPASYYSDPQSVVADDQLAHAQKIRFLTEWAQDIADRQTAAGEGMGPDALVTGDRDEAVLQELKACIAQVEAAADAAADKPARAWWRRRGPAG